MHRRAQYPFAAATPTEPDVPITVADAIDPRPVSVLYGATQRVVGGGLLIRVGAPLPFHRREAHSMLGRLRRRAFPFLRQNAIALLALFIATSGAAYAANTVRSTDIVDGQVKAADIAAGAVGPAKTSGFKNGVVANSALTHNCGQVGIWKACAAVVIQVPAGHTYIVTVHSSVSGDPGNSTVHSLYCAATSGPTCILEAPDFVTFWPRGVTNAGQTAATGLTAGSHTISTAFKLGGALLADPNAHITTVVTFRDEKALFAG